VEKSVFVPSDSVMTVTKFDHCYSILPCINTSLLRVSLLTYSDYEYVEGYAAGALVDRSRSCGAFTANFKLKIDRQTTAQVKGRGKKRG
jgi:hypothetical protein